MRFVAILLTLAALAGCGRSSLDDDLFDSADAAPDSPAVVHPDAGDAGHEAAVDAGCGTCSFTHGQGICVEGGCVLGACDPGYGDCDGDQANGCETETSNDHDHCGSCNNVCAKSQVCNSGACSSDCGALTNCSGSCVDLSSDPNHCASCNHACGVPAHGTASCVAGQCSYACNSGYHACGADCADDRSTATCGASCTPCPPAPPNGAATCDGTSCGFSCNAGFHACGSACLDDKSVSSCGALCAPCPVPDHGTASCNAGTCAYSCDVGDGLCATGCCSCGDTQNDPKNCGFCGHDCGQATCSGGVCEALVVINGQSDAYAIAVDDANVYWTTSTTSSTQLNGTVKMAPALGGPATLIADQQDYPEGIVVDATNVYWTDAIGTVQSRAIAGGPIKTIASNQSQPYGIAVDATSVYWTLDPFQGSGGAAKAGLAGGAPVPIASGESMAASIAVNASGIFWTTQVDLMTAPVAGGPAVPFATNQYPYAVAADATNVYWAAGIDGGAIFKQDVAGGPVVTLAQNQFYPNSVAVDATSVYWSIGHGGTGSVMKVAKAGGTPVPLALGQAYPIGVAVNSSRVYWVNFGDGTIKSVPK